MRRQKKRGPKLEAVDKRKGIRRDSEVKMNGENWSNANKGPTGKRR
jgi:hypothetical protein